MNKWFNDFATRVAIITGRSWAFMLSVALLVAWGISGPVLHYSDTWQLFINTITTVITYLMVFVIQNSQNRSSNSTQIKLDFLLEAIGMDAKDVRELENLDDKRLEEILKEVQAGRNATEGTTFNEPNSNTRRKQSRPRQNR